MQRLIGRDQQLTRLISYDALTGLPNRYALMESLRRALSAPDQLGKVALLHIDLDNFKSVNDTLGHSQGDAIIRQVSERFIPRMPAGAMLARFAGDEFMVLLEGEGAPDQAEPLGETLLAALKSPMVADGTSFALHASIGVTFWSKPEETESDLIKKADLAMYAAKEAGKSVVRVYSQQMTHQAHQLVVWERQMEQALANGEFFLAYQPIISLGSDCICGMEALIRWRHPERGILSAGEFIPLAETTGQIVAIGEFALTQACRQLVAWRGTPMGSLRLAVNVSSVQFWRGDIGELVERLVKEYAIEPHRLELEITESEEPGACRNEDRAVQTCGFAHCVGRFRHGLLVVVLSDALPRRYAQGRPIVCRIDSRFVTVVSHDFEHRQYCAFAGHRSDCRRCGKRASARLASSFCPAQCARLFVFSTGGNRTAGFANCPVRYLPIKTR
ncbi:putative bifunctional diguanylate cyclase/phosphodiesterase [Pandoraea sputorum]|uniref:putative bifunctional diguanylate cyclase/phosphodiesterase n=1 Tax=Pandoraea sputorum TaxID=93222 RepID=UPI003FD72CAC